MFKVLTKLSNFRFNSIIQQGPLDVTWYVLDTDEDGDEYGRCFTQEERDLFMGFTLSAVANFGEKGKEITGCQEEEGPLCSIYDLLPGTSNFPKNLLLKGHPELQRDGQIYRCMDVKLLDVTGGNGRTYDLDFDVVGVLQCD